MPFNDDLPADGVSPWGNLIRQAWANMRTFINGLESALGDKASLLDLAGKADATHSHAVADVTGLQTSLDGKAASVHAHAVADVTNLQTTLDGKADDADLAGKADAVHSHAIADVTSLQTSLDGKAASSHTHAISGVTGLQTALDAKAAGAGVTFVIYNAGWPSTRPAGTTVIALSSHAVGATVPPWFTPGSNVGDLWIQHPDDV